MFLPIILLACVLFIGLEKDSYDLTIISGISIGTILANQIISQFIYQSIVIIIYASLVWAYFEEIKIGLQNPRCFNKQHLFALIVLSIAITAL